MKQLTFKDIVLGNKYVLVNRYGYFQVGDVVVAVGEDDGAICNDESSHAFRLEKENFGHNYIHYEDIGEYDEDIGECDEDIVEVGHIFKVVKDAYTFTTKGTVLVLVDIEEGNRPRFAVLSGGRNLHEGEEYNLAFNNLERIYPPLPKPVPEPSATVTIMCEGKETILSRESAKELNLI